MSFSGRKLGASAKRGLPSLAEGGRSRFTPELAGAQAQVKLESTIHRPPLTAAIDQDPTRGSKGEREISLSLGITEAGSAAVGFEDVGKGATGNLCQGQTKQLGGFAGSVPVGIRRTLTAPSTRRTAP
jgi:hypothetical protein